PLAQEIARRVLAATAEQQSAAGPREALGVVAHAIADEWKIRGIGILANETAEALARAALAALPQTPPALGLVEAAEWQSTPGMRARVRELANPEGDDFDRAVVAILDDLEKFA
ncbi:MAG: hypothetical protein JO051_06355, partial [Acidobacteriaceae bacterium]|nr:hypothetical protein [Acidobacteriaceae bacterium]